MNENYLKALEVAEYFTKELNHYSQKELPGLKGFSATNTKRMKAFYTVWSGYFTISPSVTDQFITAFLSVSFTHHIELLTKTKIIAERQFYIGEIATEFWSVATLKHHLKNQLFNKTGKLPNNFSTAITGENLRTKALQSSAIF